MCISARVAKFMWKSIIFKERSINIVSLAAPWDFPSPCIQQPIESPLKFLTNISKLTCPTLNPSLSLQKPIPPEVCPISVQWHHSSPTWGKKDWATRRTHPHPIKTRKLGKYIYNYYIEDKKAAMSSDPRLEKPTNMPFTCSDFCISRGTGM